MRRLDDEAVNGGEHGGELSLESLLCPVRGSTNLTDGGERFFVRRVFVVAIDMPESCLVKIDLTGAVRVCTVEQEPMEETLCLARETPLLVG